MHNERNQARLSDVKSLTLKRWNKSNVTRKIVLQGFSFLFAIITEKLTNNLLGSIFILLMTAVIVEVVDNLVWWPHAETIHEIKSLVESIREEGESIKSLKQDIQDVNSNLASIFAAIEKWGVDDLSLWRQYSTSDIPREEMKLLWAKLVCRFTKSFYATNYTADFIFPGPGLKIQSAKQQWLLAHVKRVFIVDNTAELDHTRKVFELGKQDHFPYITSEQLKQCEELRPWFVDNHDPRFLDSWDFGIFDERLVFVWHLEEGSRKISKGKLEFRPDRCKHYFDAINALLRVIENQHDASGIQLVRVGSTT